jgi:hypothetical protein
LGLGFVVKSEISDLTTDIYARADSKQKRDALENAYININPQNNSDKLWEKDKTLLEWLQGLK